MNRIVELYHLFSTQLLLMYYVSTVTTTVHINAMSSFRNFSRFYYLLSLFEDVNSLIKKMSSRIMSLAVFISLFWKWRLVPICFFVYKSSSNTLLWINKAMNASNRLVCVFIFYLVVSNNELTMKFIETEITMNV